MYFINSVYAVPFFQELGLIVAVIIVVIVLIATTWLGDAWRWTKKKVKQLGKWLGDRLVIVPHDPDADKGGPPD